MTNVEALKACYVAIGGSAADVADAKTTAAVIEAISTIASGGGGGGIISVTVDDSGANITAREVITALAAGTPVFYIDGEEGDYGGLFQLSYWMYADDVYSFWSAGHTSEDPAEFTAASLDDRLAWA